MSFIARILSPRRTVSDSVVGNEVRSPLQGELDSGLGDGGGAEPVVGVSESCGGDGSRAPPEDVAACGCDGEDGGGAVDGLAESTAGDKVRAPRRYGKRKRKRKQRGTEEEELEAEVEPAHDSEDDCAVYGDADCDEVDDAVGGGDNQDDEVHGGLRIEEDVNVDIGDDFPEAVREDGACTNSDSGDDIWEEDKIPDPLSSDEDEFEAEDREEGHTDVEDPEGLIAYKKTYNSPEDFKLALLRYSLKTRYDIKLYRSEAMMVGAKCCYVNDDGVKCPWRVYCSYEKKKHKMQVRVYINEHVCVRSGYSKMLKRSSIALLFEERLRLNPKLKKNDMVAEIKREYNLEVTPDQCAKAKTKVLSQRRISHETHFARIWDYQAEVLQQNKESEFEIETIPGPVIGSKQRFDRLYICFKSQKDSWKQTCRPIIGLDGCFLKWDIKGHLLAAVARDGDNRIVPIAWAVVEIENDNNWDWFVRHISASLDLGEGSNVAIISDKQSGLVKAVHALLPQAEHRQCAKHIMDNWKKDNHDQELQRLFWKIARSYTTGEYTDHMEELKKYNPQAYRTLQVTNPITWSRAFFKIGTCCNDNLNNLCESFNRTIRQARRKPLLDMLEDIRRQCMVRTAKRFIIADRMKTRFTTRAHAEIEKMIAGAQHCKRYMARNNLHEITLNDVSYYVDMSAQTCGCRKWQMVGIPCVHAASVMIGRKEQVEDYVNDYYTRIRWRETYRNGIRHVQGMPLWPRLNRLPVLPPPWRRGNPGRPSNYARRKGRNETSSSSKNNKMSREKRIMTCSNCNQEGHNKLGCKNPSVVSMPKRPRGRPKKTQEPIGSQSVHGSQGQGVGSQAQGSQAQARAQVSQAAAQAQESQEQGSQGLSGYAAWFECSS